MNYYLQEISRTNSNVLRDVANQTKIEIAKRFLGSIRRAESVDIAFSCVSCASKTRKISYLAVRNIATEVGSTNRKAGPLKGQKNIRSRPKKVEADPESHEVSGQVSGDA